MIAARGAEGARPAGGRIVIARRNAAADMGADTIVPASNIVDGRQTFDVYRCLRR
ncbi:MAG: DUF4156 domain-containing protein [Betaproteobacteria bacterium]|nr:DUF4156 domain-containing protein [Betaproteobacteria bacterium]MDH5577686.1 DUF4156 domain-containing protein [Betaproteobacteria bacterium]